MTATRTEAPLLPGGYGRSSYFLGGPAPTLARGDGCHVYDDTGAKKLDLNNNYTVLVHGHGYAPVRDEIVAAAHEGVCFGAPNAHELAHAAELVGRIPWAEQVRYTNSGTEAVMTAIRIARAGTGRDVVVIQSPGYHGTADTVLPAIGGSANRGLPGGLRADIVTIPPGDADALAAAVHDVGDRLAAVLLDLIPTAGGAQPVPGPFVETARRLTAEADAMLVVDEVISFRLASGGLGCAHYGLEPDLLVLGKVIGGGLPVGAVVGRRTAMALIDPYNADGIPHGGTFSANPVTMRAGRAALEHLDEAALARINGLGDRLRDGLNEILDPIGWHATGLGSIARLWPMEGDTPARRRALWRRAFDHGVLLSVSGLVSVSTVMTERTIDEAVERMADAVSGDGETLSPPS